MPFGGLLTVGLIGAGAGLVGAGIQAHQTGKAVDAQQKAGEENIQLQRDILKQQQENLAPWRSTGASAITTLGGLLGLPAGGGGGAAPASNTLGSTFDAPVSPGQANFAGYSPTGGYIGKNVSMSEQMSNPNVNLDANGYTAQQHGASSYGPPMLIVKAPTGETKTVPADQVSKYTAAGATVVGRA